MDYTITASKCGKYIIVTVTGEVNRQSAMKHNLEAHALGKEIGVNKYLVDVTAAVNTDTILNNYETVHKDTKKTEDIDVFARVSVLTSPDDHSHDFIETVSRNAGLLTRLFTDRQLAIEYLLK